MKILVCGGRHYSDRETVFAVLDRVACKHPDLVIIQGGARGADRLAWSWANSRGIETRTFVADWENQGKAAGTIRNKRMLEVGRPDAVIAFPGGVGTAHMVRIANAAKLPVWHPVG
jgi:hypothetical protein